MAYGGPNSLDDIEPYLLDVRGNRPTAAHIVEEVRARYAQIGGRSPILERTAKQAEAIERALLEDGAGEWRVEIGMRHWHPFIVDTLKKFEAEGITNAVGVVLAPHYSRMSIGAYETRVADACSPVAVRVVQSWHLLPGYLDATAERVRAALARFGSADPSGIPVLFTAHSLPERILSWGDPYPAQLNETVAAVMQRLGPRPHGFAFQSAAMTPDPWLGPDAKTALTELAAAGHREVVIAPIGFTCEHVEILFDVDIEFQRHARELGIRLERTPMLDDAPEAMQGLAALVRGITQDAGWR